MANKKIGSAFIELKTNADKMLTELNQLEKKLKDKTISEKQFKEQAIASVEAIKKQNQALVKTLEKQGEKVKQNGNLFGGLKDQINSGSVSLSGMIPKLGAIGAGIGVAIMAAHKLSQAFEKATNEAMAFEMTVKEIGTLLTKEEKIGILPGLESEIDRIAIETGKQAADVGKGIYQAISATISPEAAAGVVEKAALAGIAGLADTSAVVDVLTNTLNALGMNSKDANETLANTDRVLNNMFQTVRKGKTTLPELAAHLGTVMPMARMAGVSIEDVSASMVQLTLQGLNTAESSVRLNRVLTALADKDKIAELMKRGATAIDGTTGKIKDFQKLMQEIGSMNLNLTQLGEIFPEIRAQQGIAILSRVTKDGFTEIGNIAKNSFQAANLEGVYETEAQYMLNTTKVLKDRTEASHKEMWKNVGMALLPMKNQFLETSMAIANTISGWFKTSAQVAVENQRLSESYAQQGEEIDKLGSTYINNVAALNKLNQEREKLRYSGKSTIDIDLQIEDQQNKVATSMERVSTKSVTLGRDFKALGTNVVALNGKLNETKNQFDKLADLKLRESNLQNINLIKDDINNLNSFLAKAAAKRAAKEEGAIYRWYSLFSKSALTEEEKIKIEIDETALVNQAEQVKEKIKTAITQGLKGGTISPDTAKKMLENFEKSIPAGVTSIDWRDLGFKTTLDEAAGFMEESRSNTAQFLQSIKPDVIDQAGIQFAASQDLKEAEKGRQEINTWLLENQINQNKAFAELTQAQQDLIKNKLIDLELSITINESEVNKIKLMQSELLIKSMLLGQSQEEYDNLKAQITVQEDSIKSLETTISNDRGQLDVLSKKLFVQNKINEAKVNEIATTKTLTKEEEKALKKKQKDEEKARKKAASEAERARKKAEKDAERAAKKAAAEELKQAKEIAKENERIDKARADFRQKTQAEISRAGLGAQGKGVLDIADQLTTSLTNADLGTDEIRLAVINSSLKVENQLKELNKNFLDSIKNIDKELENLGKIEDPQATRHKQLLERLETLRKQTQENSDQVDRGFNIAIRDMVTNLGQAIKSQADKTRKSLDDGNKLVKNAAATDLKSVAQQYDSLKTFYALSEDKQKAVLGGLKEFGLTNSDKLEDLGKDTEAQTDALFRLLKIVELSNFDMKEFFSSGKLAVNVNAGTVSGQATKFKRLLEQGSKEFEKQLPKNEEKWQPGMLEKPSDRSARLQGEAENINKAAGNLDRLNNLMLDLNKLFNTYTKELGDNLIKIMDKGDELLKSLKNPENLEDVKLFVDKYDIKSITISDSEVKINEKLLLEELQGVFKPTVKVPEITTKLEPINLNLSKEQTSQLVVFHSRIGGIIESLQKGLNVTADDIQLFLNALASIRRESQAQPIVQRAKEILQSEKSLLFARQQAIIANEQFRLDSEKAIKELISIPIEADLEVFNFRRENEERIMRFKSLYSKDLNKQIIDKETLDELIKRSNDLTEARIRESKQAAQLKKNLAQVDFNYELIIPYHEFTEKLIDIEKNFQRDMINLDKQFGDMRLRNKKNGYDNETKFDIITAKRTKLLVEKKKLQAKLEDDNIELQPIELPKSAKIDIGGALSKMIVADIEKEKNVKKLQDINEQLKNINKEESEIIKTKEDIKNKEMQIDVAERLARIKRQRERERAVTAERRTQAVETMELAFKQAKFSPQITETILSPIADIAKENFDYDKFVMEQNNLLDDQIQKSKDLLNEKVGNEFKLTEEERQKRQSFIDSEAKMREDIAQEGKTKLLKSTIKGITELINNITSVISPAAMAKDFQEKVGKEGTGVEKAFGFLQTDVMTKGLDLIMPGLGQAVGSFGQIAGSIADIVKDIFGIVTEEERLAREHKRRVVDLKLENDLYKQKIDYIQQAFEYGAKEANTLQDRLRMLKESLVTTIQTSEYHKQFAQMSNDEILKEKQKLQLQKAQNEASLAKLGYDIEDRSTFEQIAAAFGDDAANRIEAIKKENTLIEYQVSATEDVLNNRKEEFELIKQIVDWNEKLLGLAYDLTDDVIGRIKSQKQTSIDLLGIDRTRTELDSLTSSFANYQSQLVAMQSGQDNIVDSYAGLINEIDRLKAARAKFPVDLIPGTAKAAALYSQEMIDAVAHLNDQISKKEGLIPAFKKLDEMLKTINGKQLGYNNLLSTATNITRDFDKLLNQQGKRRIDIIKDQTKNLLDFMAGAGDFSDLEIQFPDLFKQFKKTWEEANPGQVFEDTFDMSLTFAGLDLTEKIPFLERLSDFQRAGAEEAKNEIDINNKLIQQSAELNGMSQDSLEYKQLEVDAIEEHLKNLTGLSSAELLSMNLNAGNIDQLRALGAERGKEKEFLESIFDLLLQKKGIEEDILGLKKDQNAETDKGLRQLLKERQAIVRQMQLMGKTPKLMAAFENVSGRIATRLSEIGVSEKTQQLEIGQKQQLLSNLPKFAEGGFVADTGLANVHAGEMVFSRKAVELIGLDTLNKLNEKPIDYNRIMESLSPKPVTVSSSGINNTYNSVNNKSANNVVIQQSLIIKEPVAGAKEAFKTFKSTYNRLAKENGAKSGVTAFR